MASSYFAPLVLLPTVIGAALRAKWAGEMAEAHALDKIARKINAALTAGNAMVRLNLSGLPRPVIRWQDMPSTLDEVG